MHCPNCGRKLNDNQKFCGGCGSDVSDLWQQAVTPAPVPVPEPAPAVPTPVPEPVPAAPAPMPVPEPVSAVPAPMPEPVPVEAAPAPALAATPVETASAAAAPGPAPAPGPDTANAPAPSAFGNEPVQTVLSAPAAASAANTAKTEAPKKKKKGVIGLIIGLSAAGLAIVIAAVVGIAFFVGRATVETEHTKHTHETAEPTPAVASATRTIMVYAIGTDLESNGSTLSADVKEMMAATPGNNVNIVLQTGGCKDFKNKYMEDGKTQRFSIVNGNITELENLGDVSMVEKESLEDFIKFGKERFPAQNYILVLWDHGGGVPLGFGFDELHEGILTEIEMAEAIGNCDIEFESIIFNACLMGSLEVARALDPYTEYIIAAESPTWGSAYYDVGINYTNFINFIGKDFDGDAKDYGEFIVRDYMDSIDEVQNKTGYFGIDTCMSAIDTDNIDEVFEAYERFIAALDTRVFNQDGYVEYVQIRDDCGSFESTDSVDLTTLASKYINCGDKTIEAAASSLINEVGNCVFTESNNSYTYAHGMTTYAPYLYPEFYDDARITFTTLGYSDTTVKFYDKFVSKELYILNHTEYAGSWYVAPADAKDIQSGNTYDISDLVVDMDGYEAIKLSPEDWEIIREVKVTLAYMLPDDNEKIYYMGTDNQYTIDSNGYIILQNPTRWVYFKGFGFVTCECLKYETTDDGKWYKYLGAEAIVNGQTAYVVIAFSSDEPEGEIIGYYYADIINDTFDANQGNKFNEDDTDTIIFVYEYYDVTTGLIEYEELGDAVNYSTALSNYKYSTVDYSDVTGYIAFDIYDVYNNDYRITARPGKPAYEIDAARGDNGGSSSGSDYDQGTMDVSVMVGTCLFYSNDTDIYMAQSDWTSPNDELSDDSIYYSSTDAIVLTIEVDSSADDEYTYTYYYSSDSMFSQKELSDSVCTGTATPVSENGGYYYNFTFESDGDGMAPGYYILAISTGTNKDRVCIAVCQVVD